MALARRRPLDGSWGPTLVTRRRSPWNRANWARGLLSTVQTNTAVWPWPMSRRADSLGGSGGSAGTAGTQVTPSPAHHILAATLCPTRPSTHSPGPPFLMPKPCSFLPKTNPSLVPPMLPPQPSKCPTLPLPITHRAHSGPQGQRAGHQPQKGCGRHRGQHLFWPQAAVSWSPEDPGPKEPHSGTRRSWQGHCWLPGSHCKSGWLRCPPAACVMV